MPKLKNILFGTVILVSILSQLPKHFYYWLGSVLAVGLGLFTFFRFRSTSDKYINANGYVVLSKYNELEHRYLAKQILGRNLENDEVVHHINGKKTDNRIRNLCLMNSDKHEFFHSWLRWKKEKTGRYPSIKEQKRVLEEEYGGTLLENIRATKLEHITDEVSNVEINTNTTTSQKRLFEELRKERKRLATENNVPVYMIFDNKTLLEMSERMPDSEATMLQVRGVGTYKYQQYGAYFIAIVKKFKTEVDPDPHRKKDTA